jgi:HSP20 family protein
MAEATKLPVKIEKKAAASSPLGQWTPIESLRREVDRLFDRFHEGALRLPFGRPAFDLEVAWPRETSWAIAPAVDVAEKE